MRIQTEHKQYNFPIDGKDVELHSDQLVEILENSLSNVTARRFVEKFTQKYLSKSTSNKIRIIRAAHGELQKSPYVVDKIQYNYLKN